MIFNPSHRLASSDLLAMYVVCCMSCVYCLWISYFLLASVLYMSLQLATTDQGRERGEAREGGGLSPPLLEVVMKNVLTAYTGCIHNECLHEHRHVVSASVQAIL